MSNARQNRYALIIEKIFFNHYQPGIKTFEFLRTEFSEVAEELGIKLPSNLGDVIYSIRYRSPLPDSILALQQSGLEWIIEGAGRGKYTFNLVKVNRIIPNENLITIKIPDATPEIVNEYALSDEQALLAKVRYNRLIDVFLGLTTYSLQNHLRTTVKDVGQIEIDEIYVGINTNGCHYVIPVQAKGGSDQLSVVQTKQDILCCKEKFPNLITRAISAQFITDDKIAMFELTVDDDQIKLVKEHHYQLVSSNDISSDDLLFYRQNS
ncbi:endonuclease [Vibrio fluvialis]|nr:endonuclease [Vibrio fluvialis]